MMDASERIDEIAKLLRRFELTSGSVYFTPAEAQEATLILLRSRAALADARRKALEEGITKADEATSDDDPREIADWLRVLVLTEDDNDADDAIIALHAFLSEGGKTFKQVAAELEPEGEAVPDRSEVIRRLDDLIANPGPSGFTLVSMDDLRNFRRALASTEGKE